MEQAWIEHASMEDHWRISPEIADAMVNDPAQTATCTFVAVSSDDVWFNP